jgi:hypothetical protein
MDGTADESLCGTCGRRGPTLDVELHRVTSVLVFSFTRSVKGSLCRLCVLRTAFLYNLYCLLFGWWSCLGVVINVFSLINNTVHAVRALKPRGGR